MNIAFLTPEYPHNDFKRSGGLGTSIKNLAKELVKQGVKSTVFVIGQTQNLDFTDQGVRIVSIAQKKHFIFNWYLEPKRIQAIIQKHINLEAIQLIEAPDWTGITAFMKFSIPLIIRLNGSDAYFCNLDNRKQKLKHYFLEKKALQNAHTIVSVSTFTGKLTKQIFNLKHTIKTINNSINVDDFKPLTVEENKGQLLYFGTIVRKKGVLELAKIFNIVNKQNPEATLLLIGKDNIDVFENKSTIQLFYNLLSTTAKNNVTYLPEVPYQEIKEYIAKTNIVVLPSFAEAFPMTWLETLAMEKALVASNVGWANELIIDGKTGYTINPKNHNEFANKILQLLQNEDLRKSFGVQGRQHVINNFSSKVITNQNINFYKSIIN